MVWEREGRWRKWSRYLSSQRTVQTSSESWKVAKTASSCLFVCVRPSSQHHNRNHKQCHHALPMPPLPQLMEHPKQRRLKQLKQECEQTSQQIEQIKIKVKYNFFFLLHLIYESQNVSLSPILASTVQQDGELELPFGSYDLFQCTVVAYFLSTCNFPWKRLKLDWVTDEKMEVIHQVCCEHAGSSDVRGAQNTNAANPPQFLKDTQELSLRYVYYGSAPPPKPTSFSYLLNMKLISLSVEFDNVAMCTKYCSILFNACKVCNVTYT